MGTKDKWSPEYQGIVQRLVSARKARNLTQWDVARACGTDQSHISKFERFERQLDIIDYVRYCRAVNLDPCEALKMIA